MEEGVLRRGNCSALNSIDISKKNIRLIKATRIDVCDVGHTKAVTLPAFSSPIRKGNMTACVVYEHKNVRAYWYLVQVPPYSVLYLAFVTVYYSWA